MIVIYSFNVVAATVARIAWYRFAFVKKEF